MDFNKFYTSGNRYECPLQISCLNIYFICDITIRHLVDYAIWSVIQQHVYETRVHDIDELRQRLLPL